MIDNAAAALLLVLRRVEVLVVGLLVLLLGAWRSCCLRRGRRRTGARGSGWGARKRERVIMRSGLNAIDRSMYIWGTSKCKKIHVRCEK